VTCAAVRSTVGRLPPIQLDMPFKQTLYVFRQGQSGLCCFAASPSRKKLPPTSDTEGWVYVRQVHLEPGEASRFGFDADDVQSEVAKQGFALREIKRRSRADSDKRP
jgi:hypothetical protein